MAVLTQLKNTTFCSGHEGHSWDLNTLKQGLKGHLGLSLSLPGTDIQGFLITAGGTDQSCLESNYWSTWGLLSREQFACKEILVQGISSQPSSSRWPHSKVCMPQPQGPGTKFKTLWYLNINSTTKLYNLLLRCIRFFLEIEIQFYKNWRFSTISRDLTSSWKNISFKNT